MIFKVPKKIRVPLFFSVFLFNVQAENTIYFIPFQGFEHNEGMFTNISEEEKPTNPIYQLREALYKLGYKVKQTRLEQPLVDVAYIISFNVPCDARIIHQLKNYPKEKLLLFLWEPPTTLPSNYDRAIHRVFSKVFTLFDDIIDNINYFKFYHPQPCLTMLSDVIDFNHKKLCTLIVGNKSSNHPDELYSKRKEAINFFESKHVKEFDFYGIGWPHSYQTYKGSIATKNSVLKKYKFSICYENMRNGNGYITEKIFDCFVAGCVPIYWGASNVADYIPQNCFINRENFSSMKELYSFIKKMPIETYNQYLANIKDFLKSDAAFLFSREYFIDNILNAIDSSYEKATIFVPEQIKKINKIRSCSEKN